MPSPIDAALEKKKLINAWMLTVIGLTDAEEKGLERISSMTAMRNWTCRESLYDFAMQAKQATPVLVQVDHRRMALFSLPASKRA